MKKIAIASLLLAGTALVSPAQTEFRHIGFDEALKAAKQENKLVFIDFFTTWCGPCKMMSSKTFPQKEVGDFMNAKFIPLKLDAEKEGEELARQYGVQAYPTYVVVDADGKEVAKFTGYMDGQKFIDKVDAALDPEQQPARIKSRYEAGERTPKVVNAYAMQLMEQRKEDEGFKVVDEYFNSLSDADRLKPENAFLFTVYTINLDNDRARFMTAHRDEFPEPVRGDINKLLGRLYNSSLNTYFSGYMFREGKYDVQKFNDLKAMLDTLGVATPDNALVYEFVEKRPGMTDAEYFDFIKANYSKLTPHWRDMLFLNLTRLVTPEPELKGDMSKFLRANLSELSPIGIQFAGRTLQGLESED
ncbi:MAG: thioredoxin family protein [Bacteroides sp.]|nr:thioredoxin family protein [Bacteroides sp.]